MAETHSYEHPCSDTDAGGNCKAAGCAYNSDEAHYAAISRGEDVYGFVPELTDEPRSDEEMGF
jgi:hypothetical protein